MKDFLISYEKDAAKTFYGLVTIRADDLAVNDFDKNGVIFADGVRITLYAKIMKITVTAI